MCTNSEEVNKVQMLKKQDPDSSDEDYYVVNGITVVSQNLKHVECVQTQEKSTKWHEIIAVEERKINFKLDTGSKVNILPEKLFKKVDNQLMVSDSQEILKRYGGFTVLCWHPGVRGCVAKMAVVDTKETDKVAVLRITLPPETYAVLKTQISLKSLDEVTFKECIDSLIKVLAPKNIVIAECFKLWQHRQQTTESVTEYIAAIKLIAVMCSQDSNGYGCSGEVSSPDTWKKSGEVNVIVEPACFGQLAIEDVQYVGARRGCRQRPPQQGGFTHQPYRETARQNGALT
ncbi:hypothetical protein PR048_009620 [Dryococelus australis]|uniref:Peptidase A2 domain-containing protein n=1 Tax=Dryococelus australis TaxID=614101 RepID=A0ABQ9I0D8_9NEOP|nr:hypothetical protein PR048_009620 [Dryococelus australis]